jgi:predicted  nucleic acid-binding Zn-ribbon protein
VELMKKRDQNKSLADKYSTIIGIKLRTVSEMKHASSPVGEDKDASNNLLDLMLGAKSEAVRKSQALYNSLKNRQVGFDSNLTEREEITKVIETMQADKSKISSQMEVLKLELEKLSAEERKFSDEINAAEGKLAGLDTSLSIEAKEINAQLRDASENIKMGESVSEAVTSLQTFESELAKATSSLVSPTPTAPSNAVSLAEAGNRMNAYVEVMSNYFRAELNMVTFMKQRARSLQVRIPDLEREIQECKSLQMSMNVADLTKTLMDIKQNVSDDNDIARALKTEAESARSMLVERLEQYKSTVPNAHFSSTALIAIRDTTSELGLSFDKRFNSLVE